MRINKVQWYVPGMISLILLPLLSICYLQIEKWSFEKKNRLIEVEIPSDKEDSIWFLYKKNYKQGYKFSSVTLSGNDKENNRLLMYADSMLKSLRNAKDTLNGIRFEFNSICKYDYFVRTLNLLNEKDNQTYIIEDNYIWASANTDVHSMPFRCGTKSIRNIRISESKSNFFQSSFSRNYIREYWIIWSTYLLLICLSVKRLLKK